MAHLSAEGRNNAVTMLSIDDYQWLVEWIDECRGERLETFGKVKTLVEISFAGGRCGMERTSYCNTRSEFKRRPREGTNERLGCRLRPFKFSEHMGVEVWISGGTKPVRKLGG
jgi:hypothetical protein